MQPDDIIKQFEVYVDDLTELSTEEEYVLLTKVIQEVCNDRSWEFLRKTANVTTTTNTSAPLPSDFSTTMNNYFDNDEAPQADRAVSYVNGVAHYFIPKGAHKQKIGAYCYIDLGAKTLNFTQEVGTGASVEFDYKAKPLPITSNSSEIVLPEEVRYYLAQVMAIDDDIIQKSERARSNVQLNSMAKAKLLRDLSHINSSFLNY